MPCSGARRQNKVLDEVSAAILGGVAAGNVKLTSASTGPRQDRRLSGVWWSTWLAIFLLQ